MNTIGQRVLVQRATGQREPVALVSVSQASRILHLPLSERLCARDLGEVDRGMKANPWAIRRPLETACVVRFLRFRPPGGWGHLSSRFEAAPLAEITRCRCGHRRLA